MFKLPEIWRMLSHLPLLCYLHIIKTNGGTHTEMKCFLERQKKYRKLRSFFLTKIAQTRTSNPANLSALKLGKKCNFKSVKKHYLHFQKWQKINFCTRKKFKTTKNPVFFSPKIAFLVILNFFRCKN